MARTPQSPDEESEGLSAAERERLNLSPADLELSDPERLVLTLRDELYAGSWELMTGDLMNHKAGKPYVFRLVNRIEHDLKVIRFLRAYESHHHLDLGRFFRGEE